jgi:hypothetical protein
MTRSLCLALPVFLIMAGCGRRVVTGKGSIESSARQVSAFNMVEISAPVNARIVVQPGSVPSIKLSGYQSLLNEIKTEVEGTTLKITNKRIISFDTDKDITADIIVPSLNNLAIHGSGDATISGNLQSDNFQLKVSGAGDVTIESLTVSDLKATISGAGDFEILGGTANAARFSISGAGNIDAYGLKANDVSAKVSGAGDIEVTALRSLDAKVSGAGTIKYKGHPALKSHTSGIGEIVAVE